MEPTSNYFELLPGEIKIDIGHIAMEASLSLINKAIRKIFLEGCLTKANNEIATLDESWKEDVTQWKGESTPPFTIFKRLIKRLHDKAIFFQCNETVTWNVKQLKWECDHFRELISNIKKAMVDLKKDNFESFIKVVAEKSDLASIINIETLSFPARQWDVKGINYLPPEIGELINLKDLGFEKNNLKELPPEFGNLTNLTYLNLNNNELQRLPPEFGKLTALDQLNLSDNKLKKFPLELINLIQLRSLKMYKNMIEGIRLK